jgi:hypothetical protein
MTRWLTALILLGWPSAATAQERRWEVEGYGGILVAQPSSAGTTTIPPAGPPLVTSTPTFPTRATSSWFFGDGTSLLNGVLQDFGRPSRITPLDAAFAPLQTARVPVAGARVRRRLNERIALEASVDAFTRSPVRATALPAIVEAARASFASAFTDLFATGPFASTDVLAQAVTHDGDHGETAITGAVSFSAGHLGGMRPYVTWGGGAVVPRGTLSSAKLRGQYMTAIFGEVPIHETDLVSIRYTRSTTFTLVAGGGVSRDLSANWGLRVDARWLIGPDPTHVLVDAQPSFARGTPAGFIESFTNPAIQFSNDPSTGRRSTLSGDPLNEFEVFRGGVVARTIISVAVARRF